MVGTFTKNAGTYRLSKIIISLKRCKKEGNKWRLLKFGNYAKDLKIMVAEKYSWIGWIHEL